MGSISDIMYMILIWTPFLINKNEEYGDSYILNNIPNLHDEQTPLTDLSRSLRQLLDINIPENFVKYSRVSFNLDDNVLNGSLGDDEQSDSNIVLVHTYQYWYYYW